MIIIAFSKKTSKILPRLFCKKWRHVAPIVIHGKEMILYQFVHKNKIVKIPITPKDIKILKQFGWKFLWLTGGAAHNFETKTAFTCVQMTKNAIGLKDIWIQTPDALKKKIPKMGIF